MDFKEILKQDLEDVFFSDEFSEVVDFSGLEIRAIKSTEIYKEKYLKYSLEQGLGTYRSGVALLVKKSELSIPPESQDTVTLDGKNYFVSDVESEDLTYRIFLERIEN